MFNDPRRFGFMLFADAARRGIRCSTQLGVEPTGNAPGVVAALAGLLYGQERPR
jgi:formamidopyrimidine-DNA glycosylase